MNNPTHIVCFVDRFGRDVAALTRYPDDVIAGIVEFRDPAEKLKDARARAREAVVHVLLAGVL